MAKRKIILIDEEKCSGCGQCILACAEGALELVNGKARLAGDIYCDGLGACIGECPEGALRIIERDATDFDEEAAMERVRRLKEAEATKRTPLACGCPGSQAVTLKHAAPAHRGGRSPAVASTLGQWPIKLQLLGPGAPFLKDSDLLLMADCCAAAYPGLHADMLPGKAIAMGCPKLDDVEAHIQRLADIVKHSPIKSLTVIHMEVPCCRGFVHVAEQAVKRAGAKVPISAKIIGRSGQILAEEQIA